MVVRYGQHLALHFDLKGRLDGALLSAQLEFSAVVFSKATGRNLGADPSAIRLTSIVRSIPSLTKSKMWIEGESVVKHPLRIVILAVDDDGIRINETRSRYFEVAVAMPGSSSAETSGKVVMTYIVGPRLQAK